MSNYVTAALFMGIYATSMIMYKNSCRSPSKKRASKSVRTFLAFYQFLGIMLPIVLIGSLFTDSPWLLKIKLNDRTAVALRYAGSLMAIMGTLLFISSKRALSENYTPCWDAFIPTQLVTHGIYGYIRHPIYTSNLLLLGGAFLATTSLYMAGFTIVLWVYYLRSSYLEETSLVAEFGTKYNAYQSTTGRFIPRLGNLDARKFNQNLLPKDAKIAVVGGGVAGLVAAHTLIQKGFTKVTLFEKDDRVGGKVHTVTEDELDIEMGAVWVGRGYFTVQELADEFGVEMVPDKIVHTVRDNHGGMMGLAQSFGKGQSPIAILRCLFAWHHVRRKFRRIGNTNSFFSQLYPDLMMPFAAFAHKYKIEMLASFFRPFWMGCGYQYFEKIPAIYVLKLMFYFDYSLKRVFKNMLPIQRWKEQVQLRQIVGGYQHLWEKVSESITDLRLNQNVERIVRAHDSTTGKVQISANGQTYSFDAAILALDIGSLTSTLHMSHEEHLLFSEVNTYRYVTRISETRGLENYVNSMTLLDENGTPDRIGHITSFICRKERPHLIFTSQIAGYRQTEDDLVGHLRSDLQKLGGDLVGIRRSKTWNYMPYADTAALRGGFYSKLGDLQGRGNCWLVGGLMNFESVEGTAAFAKEIVNDLVGNFTPSANLDLWQKQKKATNATNEY